MGNVIALGYDQDDAKQNGVLVDALERAARAVKMLAQRQIPVLGVSTSGGRTQIFVKPCSRCRQLRSVYSARGRGAPGYYETRVALIEHCEVTWTLWQAAPFVDVAPAHTTPPTQRLH